MQFISNHSTLFEAMKHGATIITPTNRLSNQLLRDYVQYTGLAVIAKPRCFAYRTFLQERLNWVIAHNTTQKHPTLLSPHLERHLWRTVLDEQAHLPFNLGTLDALIEAFERAEAWGLDPQHAAFQDTPQTRLFQACWLSYKQKLQQHHAISLCSLEGYLLNFSEAFTNTDVYWVSFDDFSPQTTLIQSLIEAQGCEQFQFDLATTQPDPKVYVAKDVDDEHATLIAWLKDLLSQNAAQIAVVIPNLEEEAKTLLRKLSAHLPESSYSLSLGKPLTDEPMIAQALDWIGQNPYEYEQHEVRQFLQSPYLAASLSEFDARSTLHVLPSLAQERKLKRAHFLKCLSGKAKRLSECIASIEAYPKTASPEMWVQLFKLRLSRLGFPGEYSLDSACFQAYQRFMSLLDEWQQISLLSPTLKAHEAVASIKDMAKHTIFQLRKASTAIQIMGLLEAQGASFSHLWISGLTADCLPQRPRLQAFLPNCLQRNLAMPRATAARELNLARQMLKRLSHASADIWMSYPATIKDEAQLASPLISHFARQNLSHLSLQTEDKPQCLEYIDDNYLIPLSHNEPPSGGSALLAAQAKCPFQGFAAHRLKARASNSVIDGIDPRERGQVLHLILEHLWAELKTQKKLLSLSSQDLLDCINNAIDHGLLKLSQDRPEAFTELMISVEKERLLRLILSQLEFEKTRAPFEVAALEQAYQLPLEHLELSLRIDRIDVTADGKKWVIDYKSRLPTTKPWLEERPIEPQLLLYTLLDDDINTLLFLALRQGQISFRGLSDEALDIKGMDTLGKGQNWVEARETWKARLIALAEEFTKGHCAPLPSKAGLCEFCDFPALCRNKQGA